MTAHELEFWVVSAQMSAVLALALVVEFRSAFVLAQTTNTDLPHRLINTFVVIANVTLIGFAFYWSLNALYYGESAQWQVDWTRNALVSSFLLLLVAPALLVVMQIWVKRPGGAATTTGP